MAKKARQGDKFCACLKAITETVRNQSVETPIKMKSIVFYIDLSDKAGIKSATIVTRAFRKTY